MHNAVIFTEENRQLWAKNQKQKAKRAKKRIYIATKGVLSVQESLNRLNTASKELVREVGGITD